MDLQMAAVGRGTPRSILKLGAFACFLMAAMLLVASLVSAQGLPL
ncbi:MAG: hypothetical protein RL291_453 [Pseudomonadota bacterium]|jgi:hypothetical protein